MRRRAEGGGRGGGGAGAALWGGQGRAHHAWAGAGAALWGGQGAACSPGGSPASSPRRTRAAHVASIWPLCAAPGTLPSRPRCLLMLRAPCVTWHDLAHAQESNNGRACSPRCLTDAPLSAARPASACSGARHAGHPGALPAPHRRLGGLLRGAPGRSQRAQRPHVHRQVYAGACFPPSALSSWVCARWRVRRGWAPVPAACCCPALMSIENETGGVRAFLSASLLGVLCRWRCLGWWCVRVGSRECVGVAVRGSLPACPILPLPSPPCPALPSPRLLRLSLRRCPASSTPLCWSWTSCPSCAATRRWAGWAWAACLGLGLAAWAWGWLYGMQPPRCDRPREQTLGWLPGAGVGWVAPSACRPGAGEGGVQMGGSSLRAAPLALSSCASRAARLPRCSPCLPRQPLLPAHRPCPLPFLLACPSRGAAQVAAYVQGAFGGVEPCRKAILLDFFRHAFDGSGAGGLRCLPA